MKKISIVDYRPEYQSYFELFNRYWIEKFFTMEPVDEYVLKNPEKAILETGGAILMAIYEGEIVGTVALRKTGKREFEFTKMAVREDYRRRGIAEELSYAALRKAIDLGADTVTLYSHSSLKPAISLYEKIGFRQVNLEPGTYQRADVKMLIDSLPIAIKKMSYTNK